MPRAHDIALIRVQLDDAEPAIWRRFTAPVTSTLKGLHDLIQAAMGWQDYHLWEFEIGPQRYCDPDPEYPTNPPTQRAVGVKLADLIARGDLTFSYIYDFGDNWCHTVQIEGVEPAQPHAPYPHFIEGARRCPPEDVGGTPGFEGFLEAVTTPRHPERPTMLDWYGGPFDPKDINRQMIEYRFAQIAKRRVKPGLRYPAVRPWPRNTAYDDLVIQVGLYASGEHRGGQVRLADVAKFWAGWKSELQQPNFIVE